jgi:hypothetical protein
MARYIDADRFYNKIKQYSLNYGTTLGKHSGVADTIIDVLLAEPTEDVVPRSEVDKAKQEVVSEIIQLIVEQSAELKHCGYKDVRNDELAQLTIKILKKYKGV